MDRISNDPREFTPKISYKNHDLPWYSKGWEDEYLEINNIERSIVLIDKCLDIDYTIEKCKTGYNYLIQIPLYHLSEEKIEELTGLLVSSITQP